MSQSSDLLRRAIIRATKELWLADAAGDAGQGKVWMQELAVLINEYQHPLDTPATGTYYTGTSV
jgi:hypothetical protein